MDRFPSVARVAAAAWLAAGLGAVTSPVRADRPLQTEDAGILDRGDCEIELWHHTHAERDAPDGRGNAAQLKCGLGWRTDAFIAGLQGRADDQWLRAWGLGAKREL